MPLIICTRSSLGPGDQFGSEYTLPLMNIAFTGGGDMPLYSLEQTAEMSIAFSDAGSATPLVTTNFEAEMDIAVDSSYQPAETLFTVNLTNVMNIAFGAGT